MGLDIEPIDAEGKELNVYWPGLHDHYTWSHFLAVVEVLVHNALLVKVATEEDAVIKLLRGVDTCKTWTPEQCRDVHVLIRKTLNGSTPGPDPQTLLALKEHAAMVADFRERVATRLGVTPKDDGEEDSMHIDDDTETPIARLKRPPSVSTWNCRDPDEEVTEFGVLLAVFAANGWGAGFY